MDTQAINEIENRIRYRFNDKRLLVRAFTHSSFANAENVSDNEVMEFFGDAILEYLSSEYLYARFASRREGDLTSMRSHIVSAEGLYPVVKKLDIGRYLQILNGELSHKTFANLYEALLCAIYLDGGMEAARKFFLFSLADLIKTVGTLSFKDSKTLLQEYCQKNKMTLRYKTDDREGPDNKPTFHCELFVDGVKQADGFGTSKKNAEQDAAKKIVTKWRID